MVEDLRLTPALRELAVLQVGRLSQRYEWSQHAPIARHFGITDEQIAALEHDDTGPFDPTQRAVLAFVAAMVADGEVADGDYDALSARLSEQEIVEVAFVAAQYLGLARLMTALRIDREDPIGPGGLAATADASNATALTESNAAPRPRRRDTRLRRPPHHPPAGDSRRRRRSLRERAEITAHEGSGQTRRDLRLSSDENPLIGRPRPPADLPAATPLICLPEVPPR